MTVSRDAWLERFAEALGLPTPSSEEVEALLALAGTAAHASERTAAPLSTWLAGRAGIDAHEAHAIADAMAKALADDADDASG